jgi:hypothetical protein
MTKVVENDFSKIIKTSSEEDKVEKIGEIDDVGLYYNKYQEENEFIMGHKEGKLNFIVGCSKDIKKFRKALELYKNK